MSSPLTAFRSLPLPLVQLSLAAVLKCGQSFRWSIFEAPAAEPGDAVQQAVAAPHLRAEYRLCLKDRVVCLRQSVDTLYYRSVFPDPQPAPDKLAEREAETLAWLNDYFQLSIDLASLYKLWASKDTVFSSLQDRFEGIRMLRQDPWENLVSFICSSNNNISRITKMVQNLCKQYSPPLLSLPHPFDPSETQAYHPFPPPSALATAGVGLKLRTLGFGYRADYIHRTAKILVEDHGTALLAGSTTFESGEASEVWLRTLREMTTQQAREELLKFVGVGRKVADCILLMSLDKREVIPVDTHVQQIVVKHYGFKASGGTKKVTLTPKVYEAVNAKFYDIWGEYAGWAQTVLFTADLKSFSTHGLPTPLEGSPSPTKKRVGKEKSIHIPVTVVPEVLPTPPETPSISHLKRKIAREPTEIFVDEDVPMMGISQLCEEANAALTMQSQTDIERPVKKRRRT